MLTARVTFSQSPLTTRSSNREKLKSSSMSSSSSGLLLPNIPVNKDHRTLLDTLAELACEKSGMNNLTGSSIGSLLPTSLEDSSMTTVEEVSPRRMVGYYVYTYCHYELTNLLALDLIMFTGCVCRYYFHHSYDSL